MGFLWVLQFPLSVHATSMTVGELATLKLNVCVWYPAIDLYLFQGVFLSLTQCSWDRLQIHYNPDQNKEITEDE